MTTAELLYIMAKARRDEAIKEMEENLGHGYQEWQLAMNIQKTMAEAELAALRGYVDPDRR